MRKNVLTTQQLALTALMTACICILGPWTVMLPISPVPVSLANFAVGFAALILGRRLGALSCLLYLLIGLIGLPVFAGFSGGAGKLWGPTGGYLIGYLFLAVIAGFFADRFPGEQLRNKVLQLTGILLGLLFLYVFGTLWLARSAGLGLQSALAAGVLPFLPGDLLKMLIAVFLGPKIRQRLLRADLLQKNRG